MARFTSPLDHVRVAAPCSADWDKMIGTDRVRFCGQCNLNVYNLSALSKTEAEAFVMSNEGGRVCVRYYRRRDGSMLTNNCPVGLRAMRRRLSRVAQAVSTAVLSFVAGLGVLGLTQSKILVREQMMGDIAGQLVVPERAPVRISPAANRLESKGELLIVPTRNQPARSRRK